MRAADLEKDALILALRGTMPSGGFSITIRTVRVERSELVVAVALQDDDPAFPKVEAATLPYHLVAVERSHLPAARPLRYRMVGDDHTVLAAGEIFP